MPKRTQINDYTKIVSADDLELLVQDKRTTKRAGRNKRHRRNRHYVKTMLRHLSDELDG